MGMEWMPNISEYVRQLAWQLKWHQDKLNGLSEQVKKMEQELNELKNRGSVHVDRIEYRFDQLKVEKLEGTLHIGITPDAGKSIEDLAVNHQEIDLQNETEQQPYADIRQNIDDYLQHELPQAMMSLETEFQFPLGADYRQMIIDDVGRQVDDRIRHYMEQEAKTAGNEANEGRPAPGLRQSVASKVKRDIRAAVERHFRMLPRRGEEHEAGSDQ